MSRVSFEDYKKAIWHEYEIIKKNDVTGFFSDLSPAMVRDFYAYLTDNGLSKTDEEIMKKFFETKENESIKKSIINSNTDKLKPVISFLTGKTKNPDQKIRVELAAILISFDQRPHYRFLKTETDEDSREFEIDPKVETKSKDLEESQYNVQRDNYREHSLNNITSQIYKINSKFKLKKAVMFLSIVAFSIAFFYNYLNHKDCLEWQNDRYIETDCELGINRPDGLVTKIPYDKDLLSFRKITPTDTTTYFKDGKAIVWYCKMDADHLELFNAPGHHPVTKQPLRAITRHMILKYLKK